MRKKLEDILLKSKITLKKICANLTNIFLIVFCRNIKQYNASLIMERNQNDANQSQNPSTTTNNTTHLSSEQLQQQQEQQQQQSQLQQHTQHHHEMNEVELEVQQHLNEEVEAANYETVYVIEVKIF